jgi:predicted GNAT family acetyltransferase
VVRVSDVSDQVVVTRNEDESRWEARIGGQLAGFAAYQLTDELVVFTHTEVDPAFEGSGVGSALARQALDEVADEGTRKVMPLCPFIKAWIGRHPDYVHLVYGVSTGTGDH